MGRSFPPAGAPAGWRAEPRCGSPGKCWPAFAYSRRMAWTRWPAVMTPPSAAARYPAETAALRIIPPGIAYSAASRSRSTAGIERRARRQQPAPQLRPLARVRRIEPDDEVQAPRERAVEVLAEVGGEDDEALEALDPGQQVGRLEVGVAVPARRRPRCAGRTGRRPRRRAGPTRCARRIRRSRPGSSRSLPPTWRPSGTGRRRGGRGRGRRPAPRRPASSRSPAGRGRAAAAPPGRVGRPGNPTVPAPSPGAPGARPPRSSWDMTSPETTRSSKVATGWTTTAPVGGAGAETVEHRPDVTGADRGAR